MEPIIVAKNLSAGYPTTSKKIVFKDASFSIQPGEFVGILGPNGAGKTTLFKVLLGLLEPSQGQISILGKTPHRGNPAIGYVPQHHSFDSDLSIEALEIVKLGLIKTQWGFNLPAQSRKETKESMETLKIVGAEELAHRPLYSLSGGELQRIFLAQALVGNPDILLLDEPLASLDLRREGQFIKLIENVVVSKGVTVLFIAHGINALVPVLDKVMYVANGRIALGSAQDILNSKSLSALYDSPVEVLHDSKGRIAIIGAEEGPDHHE